MENALGIITFKDDVVGIKSATLTADQSKSVNDTFQETSDIFGVKYRSSKNYRITTGDIRPQLGVAHLCVFISDTLIAALNSGQSSTLFFGIEQGGAQELPFTGFDPVESEFNVEKKTVCTDIYPLYFAKNALARNQYQALLVIAVLKE